MIGEGDNLGISEGDINNIPPELLDLIKKSKISKYIFPGSEEALSNIFTLYFLDEETHKDISSLASKFLLMGLSLDYLKELNKTIERKYLVPQLTLDDYHNPDKIKEVKDKINDVQDEPLINWIRYECLDELKNFCENIVVDDVKQVVKLGNILKLTKSELDDLDINQDIDLYDTLYRLKDRLRDFDIENDIQIEVYSKTEFRDGDVKEFIYNLNYCGSKSLFEKSLYGESSISKPNNSMFKDGHIKKFIYNPVVSNEVCRNSKNKYRITKSYRD